MCKPERDRAYRRKKNFSKARRKKRICLDIMGSDWYKHDGQYIKGKIHCSCPLCREKSKMKNARYGNVHNYTHSDAMKLERDKLSLYEYYKEDIA